MNNREIQAHCRLDANTLELLETAMERFSLSARAYHRILKVSRSIADLAGSPDIEQPHLTEALNYRAMDRWLAGV